MSQKTGPHKAETDSRWKTLRGPSQANTGTFQANTGISLNERRPFQADEGPSWVDKEPLGLPGPYKALPGRLGVLLS